MGVTGNHTQIDCSVRGHLSEVQWSKTQEQTMYTKKSTKNESKQDPSMTTKAFHQYKQENAETTNSCEEKGACPHCQEPEKLASSTLPLQHY